MSEQTATKAPSKSALTKVFNPFVKPLQEGAALLHKAEEGLAAAQLAIGRTINQTVQAWTAIGGTVQEVQDRILSTIGGDYSWSYVASWQRAAVVYDELHAVDAKTADAYAGSVEALKGIGQLPKESRAETAKRLADAGTTGVRAIREAVKESRDDGTTNRSAQPSTVKLTSKLQKVAGEIKPPEGLQWTPELQAFVTSFTLLGVRIGKGGKAANKSETMAAETLSYFGPITDDDGTDA